jgi:DNA-directed RNA polymerase specialized sigma24 family protein
LHRIYSRAVFDPDAPSSKRAIAELHKRDVHEKVLKYAVWRTHSEADAGDLVADATECVCDPDRKPWDHTKRTFFAHMRRVMDDLAIERARSGHARFEVVSSELAVDETTVDPARRPDEALHDERKVAWMRLLGDRLLGMLGDRDPIATKVFRLACQGIEDATEQAAAIPCRVDEVYEALRRLKYHGARIKAEHREAEAVRMKAAREQAKKEGKK